MTTLHLCLVSERPLANLIPLLQYRPDHVALGISPGMKRQGESFRKLLVSLGYAESQLSTHPVPDHGIEDIREAALNLRIELESRFPDGQIAYNATGGNKLMSLAFAEVFMQGQAQVIYTDTAQDSIETLYPKPATEPMQSVLGIEVYLRAHGKKLGRTASDNPNWQEKAKARKALTKWLAHNADRLDSFFGALNNMASQALEPKPPRGQPPRIVQPAQWITSKPKGPWLEALEKITGAGCAQWNAASPQDLIFHDAEAAAYLAGRWLEEYLWHTLSDAKPEQAKAGAEFIDMARPADDVRNELDAIAAHRNRLLLVECKTGNLDGKDEIVYKLDSIANDMGLFQQRLLVSARPLPDAIRDRAKAENIAVVEAAALGQLNTFVKHWMENRR